MYNIYLKVYYKYNHIYWLYFCNEIKIDFIFVKILIVEWVKIKIDYKYMYNTKDIFFSVKMDMSHLENILECNGSKIIVQTIQ